MPALKGNRMGGNHLVSVPGDRCLGCGQTKGHRPDCTVKPGRLRCSGEGCPATRPPSSRTPTWRYAPTLGGYFCPEHA